MDFSVQLPGCGRHVWGHRSVLGPVVARNKRPRPAPSTADDSEGHDGRHQYRLPYVTASLIAGTV